ncbi:MAG: hypothetical protein M0038_00260 [Pseudomonadota bacterium]|nr:hypothetical protein [Pseudomonadota bacterium]
MNTAPFSAAAAIETCIEALDEATALLSHHPPQAVAAALAAHLQGLLATLHAQNACSAQEIRQWLEEIARGACGEPD